MKGLLSILLCALALVSAKSRQGNSDPSQAPTICAATDSDSILVAHEDCHKFYKCFEGKPVAIDCPGNLVYNPDLEYCDWPQNYPCKSTSNKEQQEPNKETNSEVGREIEICAAKEAEGRLVAHENCNSFYKCAGGVPVKFSCPDGLKYNPAEGYCDWSDNVKCAFEEKEEEKKEEIVQPQPVSLVETDNDQEIRDDPSKALEICAADDSDGILVAHEDCHSFYKCSEGAAVALACPDNLVFNPIKDYCDWPQNYECKSKISDLNPEADVKQEELKVIYDDPSEAPEICAAEGSDSILVAHEDCNKFYKCYKGLPVAIDCPLNLLYNPPKEYCDWPYNVVCGDRNV